MKTLANSDINGARKNIEDLVVFGDGDSWKLICKASSNSEGWMKSTKAMPIAGMGCLVQVTTFHHDEMCPGVAEAVTFVPGVVIEEQLDDKGQVIGRKLVKG